MAAKRQYQREMDAIIARCGETGQAPRLLLHACCAPCSSWCMEYLSQFFRLTVFFYNPNITEPGEYRKRAEELRRLIREQPHRYPVDYLEGAFEPGRFFAAARGLENCPEGGDRCRECFRLRLGAAAGEAARGHVDPLTGEHEAYGYFTTTLTISPLKDAVLLNTVGEAAAALYAGSGGAAWLPSDFKKKGGYQRSIELSRQYGLYRQNYCGCVFSKSSGQAGW